MATAEQQRVYQEYYRRVKIDGATLTSRMPRRKCAQCKGTGTLAPGGNEEHRRACGQCLGRGYFFTGKEAPRGSWFEHRRAAANSRPSWNLDL
jgi:DnaJ-class molecular chaperone